MRVLQNHFRDPVFKGTSGTNQYAFCCIAGITCAASIAILNIMTPLLRNMN